MAWLRPVNTKGFVGAGTHPGVAAVGIGEPHGNAITCQAVAGPTLVHPKVAETFVTAVAVKPVGLGHVGGGAHVTFAAHPADCTELSEVNTNVKHPFVAEEVKEGGNAVPVNVANKGAAALFPSYTLKKSKLFSVANEVNVTVTKSPGVEGQMVTVLFSLAA
ncbi:hypothetical protein FCR2A7T_05480 [Flavobacterium cauense R2A-7]|nr:hypothetical protein FCR2A7T_05480 [Flavobacterium cauense R2A-7]